ncbi:MULTISPECIES: hypothetical protein [unclassified Yoonia]|uniref:hypothetical protein n=1 Tax=unclassified Yoonia TaxID=2629118 RepID=UPI002AFE49AE|nr:MULTISPECIES: hypothetical protein [unclassified Yoonia]
MTTQPNSKLPTKGGSFIREDDGSLRKIAGTAPAERKKPAPARAKPASAKSKSEES